MAKKRTKKRIMILIPALICALGIFVLFSGKTLADSKNPKGTVEKQPVGGGYAVTKQIPGVSYASIVYDVTTGLPTSDANAILCASDGYIWIGGYSGVIRHDGTIFETLSAEDGLTSCRGLFEDSQRRIWVGTNDNGVVILSNNERTHLTNKEGLPSQSIRTFAEDAEGNIYVGTTAGICYVDSEMRIHAVDDKRLATERVLRLDSDQSGRIYGQTKNGLLFAIEEGKVIGCYSGSDLGIETITTILTDPANDGKIYIGTEGDKLYYGEFGQKKGSLTEISVSPITNVHWLCHAADRVIVSSTQQVGYLNEKNELKIINNLPMDSSIEMMTADYQGNLWFASSTQGVMKIVANRFEDLSRTTKLEDDVVNTTCILGGNLYIGTENGLVILNELGNTIENNLTRYIGKNRIRDIKADEKGTVWIATFENDLGLVCRKNTGEIKSYTTEDGLPSNEIRTLTLGEDGTLYIGTNGGVAVMKDGKITRSIGADDGLKNTVILTLEVAENGDIYAGSDGDGLYVIHESGVTRMAQNEGLLSDVIMRVKKDPERGVYWIITSNSIAYLKDGKITTVSTFPYNNNYDLFFAKGDIIWVLSSCGVYTVSGKNMLEDNITGYGLYTVTNGLSYVPTSNSCSGMDDKGNLYIAGRSGVTKVNIDSFVENVYYPNIGIRSITFNGEEVTPNEDGTYTIPAGNGRIRISPTVLDYSMSDSLMHLYLKGREEEGIIKRRSENPELELTGLKNGNYVLHIQILDHDQTTVLQEKTITIVKKPRFFEVAAVRIIIAALIALAVAFVVWRIMTGTVIRKQYSQIREAKEEAERANTAKSRFLANMSRNLLTPLGTVMGKNEMILREDSKDVPKPYFMSVVNYALDIKGASESLNALLNDLIEISYIESGKMHLDENEYDIIEMLLPVVSTMRNSAFEKGLAFRLNVQKEIPRKLIGDAEKIRQIIMNLLSNAVKYTEEGSVSFTVSLKEKTEEDCEIEFLVKDTGIGIREEDKEKLFCSYEFGGNEEKNANSTGLGLEISMRFANLMGGNITCESVEKQGSEFVFDVTQKIADAKAIGNTDSYFEQDLKGPYIPHFVAPEAEILVADSSPMNQSLIRDLLKETRVFVSTALTKEDFLEKIKFSDFNVALLDPALVQEETLSDFLGKVKTSKQNLPIYAFTTDVALGEESYKKIGFEGLIAKPVDCDKLETVIMSHLPEQIMEKPLEESLKKENMELPAEYNWIHEVDGIVAGDGIKASGGVKIFLSSLRLYYEMIDRNTEEAEKALSGKDYKKYIETIHIIKTSSNYVGIKDVAVLSAGLEAAVKRNDYGYIDLHNEELLSVYKTYRQKLSPFEGITDKE